MWSALFERSKTVAATFAEAGEFEKAREFGYCKERLQNNALISTTAGSMPFAPTEGLKDDNWRVGGIGRAYFRRALACIKSGSYSAGLPKR